MHYLVSFKGGWGWGGLIQMFDLANLAKQADLIDCFLLQLNAWQPPKKTDQQQRSLPSVLLNLHNVPQLF